MHDAPTFQQVKQLADRVPRPSYTNTAGGWYYSAGKEIRVRDLQMSETRLGGEMVNTFNYRLRLLSNEWKRENGPFNVGASTAIHHFAPPANLPY
jgi:hypothetical protein